MAPTNPSLEFTEAFQRRFRDCFPRRETWERFLLYLLERINGPKLNSPEAVLSEEKGSARSRQRFLSDAVWDAEKVLTRYHEEVRDVLGDRDGALVFLEAAFAKKGSDSAGAARQPWGKSGRLRNAQVGIFAVYVSRHGAALVDGRLFIPEQWFAEDAKEKCLEKRKKCRFPETIVYRTKTEIALEIVERIQAAGILPFRFLLAGMLDGSIHDFIRAIENNPRSFYFLPLSKNAKISTTKTISWKRQAKYFWLRYFKKLSVRVVKKIRAPIRAWSYIRRIPAGSWHRLPLNDSPEEQGDEFTRRRLAISIGDRPARRRWLLVRRSAGKRPVYNYYISNAPAQVRLAAFVRLSGVVEEAAQCLQEATIVAGLNRYAVRTWTGWHRHILACLVVHFFLSRQTSSGAVQGPI